MVDAIAEVLVVSLGILGILKQRASNVLEENVDSLTPNPRRIPMRKDGEPL
jgi:hypothetical protein